MAKRHLPLNHYRLATRCGIGVRPVAAGRQGERREYQTRAGTAIQWTQDYDDPDLCRNCFRFAAADGLAQT